MTQPENHERLGQAVRRRQERRERWQREGERSLGQNFAMIGALGWTIVVPTLLGIFAGRWLDRTFHSGIFWTWACSWQVWQRAAHLHGRGCTAHDPHEFDHSSRTHAVDGICGSDVWAGVFCGSQAQRDAACPQR
ncbi:H(+)-transporting ATP synthase, gene 1 [Bradyrhizobium sp. BTAi1]|nr:H(+)-transporting ATP synthase, gene 1 [Bradyrhizobium sp. BTAi1]MDU6373694.1 AtpZ/AtpI family protein [Bradyrhizobium sp.]